MLYSNKTKPVTFSETVDQPGYYASCIKIEGASGASVSPVFESEYATGTVCEFDERMSDTILTYSTTFTPDASHS